MKTYHYTDEAKAKDKRTIFLTLPLIFAAIGIPAILFMKAVGKDDPFLPVFLGILWGLIAILVPFFRYRICSVYWNNYRVELQGSVVRVESGGKTLFQAPVSELSSFHFHKPSHTFILGHARGGIQVPAGISDPLDFQETMHAMLNGEPAGANDHSDAPERDLLEDRLRLVFRSGVFDRMKDQVAFSTGHPLRAFPVSLGIAASLSTLFSLGMLDRGGVPFGIAAAVTGVSAVIAVAGIFWRQHVTLRLAEKTFAVQSFLRGSSGRIESFGVNPCRTLSAHSRFIWIETLYYLFVFDGQRLWRLSSLEDTLEQQVDLGRDLAARSGAAFAEGPVEAQAGSLTSGKVRFAMNWWIPAAVLAGGLAGPLPRMLVSFFGGQP